MTTTDESWVPVQACTLPTTEQPLRAAEFDELFATTLTGIDAAGGNRVRLSLVGEAGLLQRVRTLADRESACCAFFDFDVQAFDPPSGAEGVLLDIAVPPAHADVLAALVQRAQVARAKGSRP